MLVIGMDVKMLELRALPLSLTRCCIATKYVYGIPLRSPCVWGGLAGYAPARSVRIAGSSVFGLCAPDSGCGITCEASGGGGW
jgi:hypothetical protein